MSGNSQVSELVGFFPQSVGEATLSVETPSGFTTSSNLREVTARVHAPSTTLVVYDMALGRNLQGGVSVWLPRPAPAGGLDVTVEVADAGVALLSLDPNVQGSASIVVHVPEGTTASSGFFVQALSQLGAVAYTATAEGYDATSATITVSPSGFVLSAAVSCFVCQDTLTATVYSGNFPLHVVSAMLDPTTLNYVAAQPLRGGFGQVALTVSNDNESAGVFTPNPVPFNPSDYVVTAFFDPRDVGMSHLQVVTPAGFDTPSNFQVVTATVNLPSIFTGDVTVGKDLQTTGSAFLEAPPPADVDVTIASSDPSRVRFSESADTLGDPTGTLTFESPAGQQGLPTFYVQALDGPATVTFTISAPGFNTATGTINVYPSGFVIPGAGTTFTTHVGAIDTTLSVYPAALDPVTLNLYATQALRPGKSNVVVTVTSQDTQGGPNVGSITQPVLTFVGAHDPTYSDFRTTSFHPQAVGSAVIEVHAPAGFSPASNNNHITAQVDPAP
jgi:hypothetical protein